MEEDAPAARKSGSLVIIGGHEDRTGQKQILSRFVELSGGPASTIVVLAAASKIPERMWHIYDRALGDMGVANRSHLEIGSRADANEPAAAERLAKADGIFITGGDQKRLLARIGGTATDAAMHKALFLHGACIAGTSAGASAMSAHMLAEGRAGLQPEKGAVSIGAGLGLLRGIVIDQHFSQRHRLARLLAVAAQGPCLYGAGVDEDTALVVEFGVGIEVIGQGSVTVVDARDATSNVAGLPDGAIPELLGIRLHLLPAGSRHTCGEAPEALRGFMQVVTGNPDR